MGGNGFYFAFRQEPVYGFSIALVYIKENKDLQFSIQLFDLMLAVGYEFGGVTSDI